MKDCALCGAMIPFWGTDICKLCADKIHDRELRRSAAYHAGREAYKLGKDLCTNPFVIRDVEFINWADGWLFEKYIMEHKDAVAAQKHPGSN